jgi:hypothetical protein
MSKYTTEVRYICETLAGLNESVGYADVDQVIKNCLPKVFDFNFPIFDESYRSVLETKILRHYYTREIGLETVGLWKLKLSTKLNEIMPYYNKLYKSELIEFNPLYDVDLTRERKIEGKGTKDTENGENRSGSNNTETTQNNDSTVTETGDNKGTTNGTANGTQNQNTNGNGTNMYSDTPQGAITDLQAGRYLTNATIDSATNTFAGASSDTTTQTTENTNNSSVDSSGSVDGTTESDFNSKMDGFSNTTLSNTEDYLERVIGSNGGESFSKRINDYRTTFINIDMMVINDLEDLFFGLW